MNRVTSRRKMFTVAVFSTIAIIVALFMMPSRLSSVDGQASFSVEYDTDRSGSDYKNFDLSQANHEVCRNYCAADSTCKAYTYTKPYQEATPHCWLKNSVPNPVPYRDCCISGVKNATFNPDGGMGAREDDTSLTGTNLSYYARPAFETCQSDCKNNASCKGFTWIQAGTYSPNDAAMCYLMSSVTGRSSASGHYSGVKGASGGGGGGGGDTSAASFAGEWNIGIDGFSFYSVMRQEGNRVTGTLDGAVGTIQGEVTGKTFRFRLTYNGTIGAGTCVLSDDGKSFKGFFGNSNNTDDRSRGYWNGTKR